MTFAAYETGQDTGSPVELYSIAQGGTAFRFTSAIDDYTYASNVYPSAAVSRDRIVYSAERKQDTLKVSMPSELDFPQLYKDIVPSERATLTITRVHRDDPDQEGAVLHKGIVQVVAFSNDGFTASLTVIPLSSALSQSIPRKSFQGLCSHFLYDGECQVAQNSFKHEDTILTVLGAQITVQNLAGKGDGWATGGFAQIGSTEFRLIMAHAGDIATLLLPFPTDVTGSTVSVFAGCAHTRAICASKFGNFINYGGFAWVPLINIYADGLV